MYSNNGVPLEDPVFAHLLPDTLEYVGNPTISGSAYVAAGSPAPVFEEVPNYGGTGRTLLRWSWPGWTLNPTGSQQDIYLYFDVQVSSTAPYGVAQTEVFAGWQEPEGLGQAGMVTDTLDVDGDGNVTELIAKDTHDIDIGVEPGAAAGVEAVKWAKGELDTNYTRFPDTGLTVPAGSADYRLVVSNPGEVQMRDIVLIDILPFVGDTGVVDTNPRGSEWQPFLAGPVTAPAGITVFYSESGNPCRDELTPGEPIGCEDPSWTATAPADITLVRSLKFEFTTLLLNPDEEVIIEWPMRAPINAPTDGEVAWNSFGFIATRADNGLTLLPSEPIKTGIAIDAPDLPYIGDYVWEDTNSDGIQDAGEGGLNGVRVELFRDNGDGIADPATDAFEAFTVSFNDGSNDGAYRFANIGTGDFFLVFYPPSGFGVSPPDAGADDLLDSDAVSTFLGGQLVGITPVTTLIDFEEDNSWDFGVDPSVKQTSFTGWQSQNQALLNDQSGPLDNQDNDLYSNLLEYALCLDPGSGVPLPGGFYVETDDQGAVHARFYRPLGGLSDVTYEVHGLENLPVLETETWTIMHSIPGADAAPSGVTITDVDGTIEEVRIANLQTMAPLTERSGFIRLAVRLGDTVSYAPVWGWTQTLIEAGKIQTYANPFGQTEVLSGRIDGMSGSHGVEISGALGDWDFALILGASDAHYIEVIDGPYAGHRFDVAEATGSVLTLAADDSPYQGPPFNTVVTVDSVPSDLAGSRFILQKHHRLNDLVPPTKEGWTPQDHTFVEGHPPDRLYLYDRDWQPYWLSSTANGPEPFWDLAGNAVFEDAGATVIAPTQGLFVFPQEASVTLLSAGIVRKHPVAMPLPQGWSLQGTPFPLDASPALRAMNKDTFDGHAEPALADSVCLWLGDGNTDSAEFRCAYLFEPDTIDTPRWAYADDAFVSPRDFELMFPRDRSGFYYRHLAPKPDYVLPLPWCVELIGE